MLTQCPECKTTFRLHVNQLKAAGGQVRCSRCDTTFDALDNLFEAAPPIIERVPTPIAKDDFAPEPESRKTIGTAQPAEKETEPFSHAPSEVEPSTEDDKKERITSLFDKPTLAVTEDDTLSTFINELEESTSSDVSLPSVDEATFDEPEEITTTLDTLDESSDETEQEETIQLPLVSSAPSPEADIFSAALDSIDGMFSIEPTEEMVLPLVEPGETLDEIVSVEPIDDESLPLIELEELTEGDTDTFEEALGIEPVEEPTPAAFEPEETFDESVETVDNIFSVALTDDEPLPLLELEEQIEEDADTFEEALNVEPVEEPTPAAVEPEETFGESVETVDEILSVEPTDDEPLPLLELEEQIEEEDADTLEEALNIEPTEEGELDVFFDEAEPETIDELSNTDDTEAEPIASDEELDAFFEELEPEVDNEPSDTDDTEAEPVASDEELEAFFEELEPEADDEPSATNDTEAESVIGDEELDVFFEEAEPETASEELVVAPEHTESVEEESTPKQGDLLDIFDKNPVTELTSEPQEGPDEEAVMDEIQLPEELEQPVTPKPPIDPLDPLSEEQLENMLSPTEEQAAEEAAAKKSSQQAAEELDLDTGSEATEETPVDAETLILDETPAVTTDYTFPTELTQARRGSSTASILWGVGIVLMCTALLLQYIYYHRLQLVENPQLRPLLVTMCDITGCKLPPRRDLGRIELTEHLMQFHPNYEQSLLITATLANRADFPQPYPLVEIVMTNIEQQVVAHRRFRPEQYLPNHGGDNNFPANSEVPLMLEVLDPGNDAVGFEFRFY